MDLIYTNAAREDIGVLSEYELDLAFGTDENDFECRMDSASHCCEAGGLLYIEGTEYGGIIDAIKSDTGNEEVIYSGRTWHGILNSKIIEPDTGEAYLTVSGDANAVIGSLLSRVGLMDLFSASSETSGLTISNYQMNRYISAYDGIRKMLKTVGGKLHMEYSKGSVVLSALCAVDYTQAGVDSDMLDIIVKQTARKVNHLICLGSGELAERTVVHLYADKSGNISQTQTQTGLDEYVSVYDYANVESADELITEGTKHFQELLQQDELSVDFDDTNDDFDIGDIVGAVDNVTGVSVAVPITKKIVTIQPDQVLVQVKTDSDVQ